MSELIKAIDAENMKTDLPVFNVGDTVKVGYKIIEGGKERISCPHCITCLYHLGSLFHNFPLYGQHLPGCAHCS